MFVIHWDDRTITIVRLVVMSNACLVLRTNETPIIKNKKSQKAEKA
jgi:hypothetical protein